MLKATRSYAEAVMEQRFHLSDNEVLALTRPSGENVEVGFKYGQVRLHQVDEYNRHITISFLQQTVRCTLHTDFNFWQY